MTRLVVVAVALALCSPVLFARGFNGVTSPDGVNVWAVGTDGAVFHSADSGAAWNATTLGTLTLRAIWSRGNDMWIVGDSGACFSSVTAGGSWTRSTLTSGASLRGVTFATPDRGWIVGDNGTVLRTGDGGISWLSAASAITANLRAVAFRDSLVGYIVGENATCIKSTDGGLSWGSVWDNGWTTPLTSVAAKGSSVYVTGDDGFCVRSTDDGATWEPLKFQTDSKSNVMDVVLFDETTACFIGGGGYVRKTSDAGASFTWGRHGLFAPLTDVFFSDPQHGWACGSTHEVVLRTNDGGATWSMPVGTTASYQWQSKLSAGGSIGNTLVINPLDKNKVYVALGGIIYMSANRGETWQQTSTTPGGSTHSFYISPKDTNLYVIASTGSGDGIRRSTNRGLTWTTTIQRNYSSYGMPLEMDGSHPDTLYFAPEDSYLYRSKDFGATWETVSQVPFSSPCDFVVLRDSSNILWCGDSGPSRISRSTDAGVTWQLIVDAGSSEIPTIASSSLDNSVGFATVWGGGGVRRTQSFGGAWSQVVTTGSAWGCDIAKDDPNVVIFGVYGGGQIYISTNGGSSFSSAAISGSNYAVMGYDRSTFLAQQSGAVWKLGISYTVPATNIQSVGILSPNGGEVLHFGTTATISWVSSNFASVKIEYQTVPDGPWYVISENTPAFNGSYEWTVPPQATHTAAVRISDAADGDPSDISDKPFSIAVAGITATPSLLDFGPTAVGSSRRDTIRLFNPGSTSLVVSGVTTATSTFAPGRTSFTIAPLSSDTLSVLFTPGAIQSYSDTLRIASNAPDSPTGVALHGTGDNPNSVEETGTPEIFALDQNYPNPFNPTTQFRYSVAETRHVLLVVYDLLGRQVDVLVNDVRTPGVYTVTWDASRITGAGGTGLASGMYYYRLEAGSFVETRKLILLK